MEALEILLSEVKAHNKQEHYELITYKLTKEILSSYENNDLYYEAGIAFYFLELYDRALACFDKAIMLNPNHKDAFLYRGELWMKKKNI